MLIGMNSRIYSVCSVFKENAVKLWNLFTLFKVVVVFCNVSPSFKPLGSVRSLKNFKCIYPEGEAGGDGPARPAKIQFEFTCCAATR